MQVVFLLRGGTQTFLFLDVPDTELSVAAAGEEVAAVHTQGHAGEIRAPKLGIEGALSFLQIPDSQSGIRSTTHGYAGAAARRHGNCQDWGLMDGHLMNRF